VPDTFVEVSPKLARERNLQDGYRVKLISRYGELDVRVLVTDRVKDKEVYVPINSSVDRANLVTGILADDVTHTPAYKETSVKMVNLEEHMQTPLPRTNHRYATRKAQLGVEVQKKWSRSDYQFPQGAPLQPGSEIKG
jgi:formate dehydrogenase major subunit